MPTKNAAKKAQQPKSIQEESEKLGSGIKSWGAGTKNQHQKAVSSDQMADNILYKSKKKSAH